MIGLPFSILVAGIFVYMVMRERYQRDVYRAALEKGIPPPERPVPDPRKAALVLMSLGAAYSVAAALTFIAANRWDIALGASVWGVVPLFIGAALYRHGQVQAGERHLRNREE